MTTQGSRHTLFEGQERPPGLPRAIRKVDGRWFGDARVSFEGLETSLIYLCINDHLRPGRYRAESHSFHELFYTVSGTGFAVYNGRTERCTEGHVFVARPGDVHASRWTAAPRAPWRGLIVQFDFNLDPQALSPAHDLSVAQSIAPFYEYFLRRKEYTAQVDPRTRADIGLRIRRLLADLARHPESAGALIMSLWLDFVSRISRFLRASGLATGKGVIVPLTQREQNLLRAKSLLASAAGPEADIAASASAAHMSKFHFIRSFRQMFGITPERYFRQGLMQRAGRLLVQTDLPVAEIALRLGFADASAFTKAFRRYGGMPPLAFRRSRRAA